MIEEEDDESSSAVEIDRNRKRVVMERRRLTNLKFMVQLVLSSILLEYNNRRKYRKTYKFQEKF